MDEGDAVVAGETLLAVIQPRDPELLDARTIAQAEAQVAAVVNGRLIPAEGIETRALLYAPDGTPLAMAARPEDDRWKVVRGFRFEG